MKEILTQKEFLQNTIDYYQGHPERICKLDESCKYSPINVNKEGISEGCAIGRHLDAKLQLELDIESEDNILGSGVDAVFEKLPKWMQNLGNEFLSGIQQSHDEADKGDIVNAILGLKYIYISYFKLDIIEKDGKFIVINI